ncbi:MipA/OmpV family protein [Erythrobacter sp. GH1-10]|uniref:MipA/OmpV family protein n=1 Tax=Erythrobacter sp. GH1-10 TaxID=3349334 RepID=UPI003877C8F0
MAATCGSQAAAQETDSDEAEVAAQRPEGGPPAGFDMSDSVFDETWLTFGVGIGLTPSYSGSDDYRAFPLPLIVGRIGGVGITPNGPGLNFDVLSNPPGQDQGKTSLSFGPTVRFRGSRDDAVNDDVVELAGELDSALEVGVQGGVRIPGVLHRFDAVTLGTAVRWDVLGAHEGMLVEPSVGYFSPLSRGAAVQLIATASFVDDKFADYYYTVDPQQSADTGLAEFTAEGGLNSIGVTAIGTVDLDGDVLNGGLNVFFVGGYSRLVGDAADTPYTSVRGSADQFIGGLGIGYTF